MDWSGMFLTYGTTETISQRHAVCLNNQFFMAKRQCLDGKRGNVNRKATDDAAYGVLILI